jgi:hypothetical protein
MRPRTLVRLVFALIVLVAAGAAVAAVGGRGRTSSEVITACASDATGRLRVIGRSNVPLARAPAGMERAWAARRPWAYRARRRGRSHRADRPGWAGGRARSPGRARVGRRDRRVGSCGDRPARRDPPDPRANADPRASPAAGSPRSTSSRAFRAPRPVGREPSRFTTAPRTRPRSSARPPAAAARAPACA